MKLKSIVLALTLVIFSIIAAISYYADISWSESVLDEAQKNTEIQSLMLAHDFRSCVKKKKKPVRTLASIESIQKAVVYADEYSLQQANQLLDIFCATLDAMTCYLMDKEGLTIASSNRHSKNSFVGKNYSFRPYFKFAIEGVPFTHLALGITSKKRGVYFSHPVMNKDNMPQGVVVIKYSVLDMEGLFHNVPGIVTITGNDGIVFATNKIDWLYKSLWLLSEAEKKALLKREVFSDEMPENIGIHYVSDQIRAGDSSAYLLATQQLDGLLGWQLSYFVELADVQITQYELLKKLLTSWPALLLFLLVFITLWLYVIARQEITKRSIMEQDLFIAKEQAEKASQAKSEFLSRMSHELRTPLNAILGFAQMLELDAKNFNDLQQENIKEILQGGHHLLYLINEVLDLSRIEAGKLEIYMGMVELETVVQQALVLVQVQANRKQLRIINHLSGQKVPVYADHIRLKQVIVNLLSNAVKYNREYGSIVIDYYILNEDTLSLSISDTGYGISDADMKKLFIPFERLNTDHNVEGAGIGLVITRHLMMLMGGQLGAQSRENEGSTFWLELQRQEPQTEPLLEPQLETKLL